MSRPRKPELPPRPSGEEIDEELSHHLRGRIEELMARGYDRAAAEREAHRSFGDPRRARREVQRVYRPGRALPLADILREVVHAARSLRRRPVFTVTAVLLLAIGIGATTAMLAVIDAYLFRDMPYPAAERLVWVRALRPDGDTVTPQPPPVDWRELSEIELAVSWDLDVFTLVGDGKPQVVRGAWVPPDYVTAFGVEPAMGRGFTADEGAGPAPVAMIGYDLWQSRYGGDPDIAGRTVRMYASDRPEETAVLTIVGVLPADWWHVSPYTQILAPLAGPRTAYVVRLAPDVAVEQAAARMTTHAREVWGAEYDAWEVELTRMHDRHVGEVRPLIGALGAAVALVLLIACANVAVLLVVQSSARLPEFAVRAALGAGRGRMAGALLAEAALLSVAGATLGLLAAGQGLAFLAPVVEQQFGTSVPGGTLQLALAPRVALASVGITAAATLLFGLAPLAGGFGRDLASTLAGAGRAGVPASHHRLRSGLIVLELALSLALLAGAGLTLRTAFHLATVDLGYETAGLVRMGMGLSAFRYPTPADWNRRIDEVTEAFRTVPGVEAAAAVAQPPPFAFMGGHLLPMDGPLAEGVEPLETAVRRVGPGYFDTLELPLLRGRDFGARDTLDGAPVAILSERLADRLWPGEQAIGRLVRDAWPGEDTDAPWRQVVGVVGETREDLTGQTDLPDAYVPAAQVPMNFVGFVVRSQRPLASLITELEARVWEGDPEQPLTSPGLVEQRVSEAGATPATLARLLVACALFGVLLAVVGVYGVIAFSARQRRREIAVRIALGAVGRDVRRMVLWHGARVVGLGLVAGLGGAALMARVLASQIHGVTPTDPVTFAAVTVLLGGVALAAAVLPARRAAAADPTELLREG